MIANDDVKAKISELECEFRLACKVGHVLSATTTKRPAGLEIRLPATVDAHGARLIIKYVERKYGFQATFYAKKHNISILYED
jgi:hypothetical protein